MNVNKGLVYYLGPGQMSPVESSQIEWSQHERSPWKPQEQMPNNCECAAAAAAGDVVVPSGVYEAVNNAHLFEW